MIDQMSQLFQSLFAHYPVQRVSIFLMTLFLLSLFSYQALVLINRSRLRWVPAKVRRYVFVNAEKSSSGAIQVGGLVFSLITIVAIFCLFEFFPLIMTSNQTKILSLAFYSWIGILLYGHLDDVFEIRPVVKLILQLGVIFVFCLRVSNVVYPEHSAFAFIVMTGLSTLILNGTNLIDGLDTLTFKVSTSIFAAFIILSSMAGNTLVLFMALMFFSCMCGFYFVNREPSKVHMGEVGVGSLGFSYVVLSTLVFESLRSKAGTYSATMLCLLPCALPIVEITVSSTRRVMNNKSPFKGDKLHAHHILHLKKGLSTALSSTIIATVNFTLFLGVYLLLTPTFSILSFGALLLIVSGVYFLLAHRIWFGEEFSFNLKFLENILVKKDVRIIPSDALSDFKIILPQKFNRRKTDHPIDKDHG